MTEMHSFVLPNSEVHVWRCSLRCPEESIAFFAEHLAHDEKVRAGCYRFARDRRRFILGRTGLRLLLARYLERDARSILFRYGYRGKPQLDHSEKMLRFNLSHSDELVLYCFSRDREVGIDVERVRVLAERDLIAEQVLSDKELSILHSAPPESRDVLFLRLWTRKESFLKALGIGISASMKKTDLSDLPVKEHDAVWSQLGASGPWFFYDLMPNPYYVGALASDSPASSLQVRTFFLHPWHLRDDSLPIESTRAE